MESRTILGETSPAVATAEKNISYSVVAHIKNVESDGNSQRVHLVEYHFHPAPKAINARVEALKQYEQLHHLANENYQINGIEFDHFAPIDPEKPEIGRELSLTLNCIDHHSGHSYVMMESGISETPTVHLDALDRELLLCQNYGYSVVDEICQTRNDAGHIISILNTPYVKPLESLFYPTVKNNYPHIQINGIMAEPDGYIRLYSNKDVLFDVATEKLHVNGEFVVVEVSVEGIDADVEPDSYGNNLTGSNFRICQPIIVPEHIVAHKIADTNNPKGYLINRIWHNHPNVA